MKASTALFLAFTASAWGAPIAEFQGATEHRTSDSFRCDGPWRLRWDFEGTALKVHIHSDASAPGAKPIQQAGSGSGSMSIEKGGTFWLDIQSVGSYRLTVESLQSGAATLPVFEGNLERKGTSVFTAPRGWKFRCTAQGVFKATLHDSQRNPVGSPVVLMGSGTSERSVGQPGQYFFMIQSTGPYKIEVLP